MKPSKPPRGHAPFSVRAGAATDVGMRRTLNEDAFLCSAPMFLVADGMGGYADGEAASGAVVEAFSALVGRDSVGIDDIRGAYSSAVELVLNLPAKGRAGPGTTLSGVAISANDGRGYWLVLNVGDSRTYRVSEGVFRQVSVDHSVVQELVETGSLTASQAASDSRRNVVTRAIGAGGASDPDFWMLPAHRGDRILVCSDGLTGEVDDDAIESILRGEADPQIAADRLVAAAREAGGRDNITAVVVDAADVEEPEVDDDTRPRDVPATGSGE